MATVPFPGSWSPEAQFTGNSDYVVDASGAIWLVAESASSGAAIYTSTDKGGTFTAAATIPGVASDGLAFDPAVAIDANGVLHIVGQVVGNGRVVLQKFTYDPSSNALSNPYVITTSGMIGSDYDIVALANGNCYIATATLTTTSETVQGIELGPTGTIVATDTLVTQGMTVGNRYGAISLWSPDGAQVEMYLNYVPKAFSFVDSVVTLAQVIRAANGAVGVPTTLHTFSARYTSVRLTVVGNGETRYLCQGYYAQQRFNLIGNVVLGYRANSSSTWTFNALAGTASRSYIEPVLSVTSSAAVLAVLTVANGRVSGSGAPVLLFDMVPTPWSLTPRTDFVYPSQANWLRGSKSLLPTGMPWGILAQSENGVARFYTGANLPPVALLVPSTATCKRGTPYMFDASRSYDLNLNALQYTWSLDDPTGKAQLTQHGALAVVTLPRSVGPAEETLHLTVGVVDADAQGNPYHPPVTASATLEYPAVALPVIAASAPIAAARNSQVSITANVTFSPYADQSYSWAQTGGTPVEILSVINEATLIIRTNGAAVAGESLFFTLTVNDGVNDPVSATFEVDVAARVATGEADKLARMVWTGTISQRNTAQTWAAPIASALTTEFTSAKRAPLAKLLADQASVYTVDHRLGFSSSSDLTLGGKAIITSSVLQMMNWQFAAESSTYYSTEVDVTSFETAFTFKMSGRADGFTFMIQPSSTTAIGAAGGGLGSSGLSPSVALKFDIYNNAGEGTNSTGVYLNGASPSMPATVIQDVILTSGHLIEARISYVDHTLNLTLIDRVTQKSFTTEFNVDIPSTIGANTAYVGFTAATGGGNMSLNIFEWTFGPLAPSDNAQAGSYLFIGPKSVLVERSGVAYHVLTPDPNDTILDAAHGYRDETIVLSSAQKLLLFTPNEYGTDTDNANETILLRNYSSAAFAHMSVTPSYGGRRIIALWGSQGMLLLQVDNLLGVTGSLSLSENIYGASNVQWARLVNVETLHSGTLLIGTVDSDNNYFETEYSLVSRQVTKTWDATLLKNQIVTTGEMLFEAPDSYAGLPPAPVLNAPDVTGTTVTLTWDQERKDLLTGYRIAILGGWVSTPVVNIRSGSITTATLTNLISGLEYSFTVQALSLDGSSLESNLVSVAL